PHLTCIRNECSEMPGKKTPPCQGVGLHGLTGSVSNLHPSRRAEKRIPIVAYHHVEFRRVPVDHPAQGQKGCPRLLCSFGGDDQQGAVHHLEAKLDAGAICLPLLLNSCRLSSFSTGQECNPTTPCEVLRYVDNILHVHEATGFNAELGGCEHKIREQRTVGGTSLRRDNLPAWVHGIVNGRYPYLQGLVAMIRDPEGSHDLLPGVGTENDGLPIDRELRLRLCMCGERRHQTDDDQKPHRLPGPQALLRKN